MLRQPTPLTRRLLVYFDSGAHSSERLGNIRELLCADVPKARAELAKHVSEIRMLPQPEGRKGHYVATGVWNLLGGFAEGVCLQNDSEKRVRMVAGEGFEPSTFGL